MLVKNETVTVAAPAPHGDPSPASVPAMAAPAPDGWTLAEAVQWLDPPITTGKLGELVHVAELTPVTWRKPSPGSKGGRPAPVYSIQALIDLHADHIRWLVRKERPGECQPTSAG